jgi:hypothetical protein
MASSPFPLELWFHVVEYLELDDFLSLATVSELCNVLSTFLVSYSPNYRRAKRSMLCSRAKLRGSPKPIESDNEDRFHYHRAFQSHR